MDKHLPLCITAIILCAIALCSTSVCYALQSFPNLEQAENNYTLLENGGAYEEGTETVPWMIIAP